MFQQCFICHLIVMENSKLTADRRRTKHLSSSQTAVAKEKGFSLPRIQRYTCTCNCTACEHQFALNNEKLLSDFIQLARSFRAWAMQKFWVPDSVNPWPSVQWTHHWGQDLCQVRLFTRLMQKQVCDIKYCICIVVGLVMLAVPSMVTW